MKSSRILSLVFATFFSLAALAQGPQNELQVLKEKVGPVSDKKNEYGQSIEWDKARPQFVTFAFTNGKGDTETFYFNLTDLNESMVKIETRRDLAYVEILTNGGKDLIKVTENGEVQNFEHDFEIMANGIEDARTISEAFKKAIAAARKEEENREEVKKSKQELLQLLSDKVQNVVINDDTWEQSFSFNPDNHNLVTVQTNDQSREKSEEFTVNLADLNPFKTDFKTKGREVLVTTETKGGRKLAGYHENGEQGNYTDDFEFKAASVENARTISRALKALATMAGEESVEDYTSWSEEKCMKFLQENVQQVVIGDDAWKQTLSPASQKGLFVYTVEDVAKGTRAEFAANAADLRPETVEFDTKGNEVLVFLETAKGARVVATIEDNEQGNYTNQVQIRATDIENGRALQSVLKRFVEINIEQSASETLFGSAEDAKAFLEQQMGNVVINSDTYEQELTFDADNGCLLHYKVTDVSKDEQMTFSLNLKDVDINKILFDTKGNEVFVHLEIKGRNKLVQTTKNGEPDNYEYETDLRASGIEQARKAVAALKYLTGECAGT